MFCMEHKINATAVYTCLSIRAYSASQDDVMKWKHFRVTGPLWKESTGSVMLGSGVLFDARLNKLGNQ